MKRTRNHFALLAALTTLGVIGVAGANADSSHKLITRQDVCIDDPPNNVPFDAVTVYGPPLRWMTFYNRCSQWKFMAFNDRWPNNGSTVAFYVPPNLEPGVTVSTATLDDFGLLNLQFDGWQYGDDDIDGTSAGPNCVRGLAGLPSYVVDADGSLTPINC